MKISVDLSRSLELDVLPPIDVASDPQALKEWLLMNYKDEILNAMKIQKVTPPNRNANQSLDEETNSPTVPTLQKRLELLDKISKVQRQFLQSEGPKVVFGCLLEGLLDLMDSEYGFIGESKYEPDGTMYLQTHAITNIAWDAATRAFFDENVDSGLKFFNLETLFGTVMTTKRTVISNQPKTDRRAGGVPAGHPPLNHFLGIPFFKKGGELQGMVGIANKPRGYTDHDVEFLEPFTVTCSNLIQAYWQVQQNRHLINTLEEKVCERTQELERANRNLEDANRKVVKASAAQLEHFACMSHEIRTPLNCIIGLSSLLQDTKLSPVQEESLRMIITSGDLLLTVVNDVLDYSKLESGNVDIVIKKSNLQETLDAIVHTIQMKGLPKYIAVHTFYDTLLPEFVMTDPRRLQQILYNLLGNAIKFSNEGGFVELHVSVCGSNEPTLVQEDGANGGKRTTQSPNKKSQLSLHAEFTSGKVEEEVASPSKCPFHRLAAGGGGSNESHNISHESKVCHAHDQVLRFVVKDYGKGIKEDDLNVIFQPFNQGSPDIEQIYGGTGLGLAITSKLVGGMGGTIFTDSKEGEWTQFTVDFPFVDPTADVDEISRQLRNVSVLLVETDNGTVERFKIICDEYQVTSRSFTSLKDLDSLMTQNGAMDSDRNYICLVHEDLYEPDSYQCFASVAKTTVLLTFGPKFSVKDTKGHFRSLLQVIPSVLLQSMAAWMKAGLTQPQVAAVAVGGPVSSVAISYSDLKILVVEDNIINQKALVRLLKRLGVQDVDVVNNGLWAVTQEAEKQYDIVFMDMQMPFMDGITACRLIVERRDSAPKPKVVFVTAHVENSFELEAIKAGSSGFLPKPFKSAEVEKCFQLLHLDSGAAGADTTICPRAT